MPVGTQDELLRLSGATNNPYETITATANGTAVYYGAGRRVDFALVVSAASGTNPTLDVTVQTSADGSTGWTTRATFPQQTDDIVDAAGVVSAYPTASIITPSTEPYVRIVKTVGGTTPSFTMAVLHNAVDSATP